MSLGRALSLRSDLHALKKRRRKLLLEDALDFSLPSKHMVESGISQRDGKHKTLHNVKNVFSRPFYVKRTRSFEKNFIFPLLIYKIRMDRSRDEEAYFSNTFIRFLIFAIIFFSKKIPIFSRKSCHIFSFPMNAFV